jgi:hypothetical protein
MSNVPVQAINSLLADKKPEPTPDWLKDTSLGEETPKPVEVVALNTVETISSEPVSATVEKEKIDTLVSAPKPVINITDKSEEGAPIRSLAEDAEPQTKEAGEIESIFDFNVAAHDRT